ncbi:LuxR family transcriptional regulator [Palleronia aestuarii]|uniref:LuxR family transcriptional regulator n=1 Tax=Palleronia aestuarii TaxID=568105 RepID=A0A2W7MX97_9RHOB|nr:autoinducer binding domain-containing protein [Palleronia aestuarii]PZX12281.1 LuxR family transcriptional regulator [Palleronia aestuarii]
MFEKHIFDRHLKKLDDISPCGYVAALHIRYTSPVMSVHTFNQDWIDHYTRNGYALRDPTVAWGFSTTGYIRWSDSGFQDPFGIFQEAAQYGLKYGVTFAKGEVSSRTIASIARDDREFTDEEILAAEPHVDVIHEMTEPPTELTKAQREALRCIAAGDRYAAAAAKLGISESAFKARLNSVRERLMARTTAEAIQRAKDYRLM